MALRRQPGGQASDFPEKARHGDGRAGPVADHLRAGTVGEWQEWGDALTRHAATPDAPGRWPGRCGAASRGHAAGSGDCAPHARPRRCRCRLGPRRPTGRWRPAARPPPLPHGAARSRRAGRPRPPSADAYSFRAGPAGHCCRSGCSGRSAAPGRAAGYPEACRNNGVAERRDEGRAGGPCHAPGQGAGRGVDAQDEDAEDQQRSRRPQPLGSGDMRRRSGMPSGVRCFSICAVRLRSKEKIRSVPFVIRPELDM